MSHVFSSPNQDPGDQKLSPEEAKELIRSYQHRDAVMDGQVTVQAMAETLGLPVWQVEQMVADLRNRPTASGPMPGSMWLKTQLWKWTLAAVAVVCIGPGLMALTGAFDKGPPRNRAINDDGIYDHSKVVFGKELGMTAPPGFSYEVKYGTVDAAANGDSRHYLRVGDLSAENVAIVQEQYTEKILDGLDKAVTKRPPDWVSGESVAIVKPNYYPGGTADPIDITLKQDAFPYKSDSAAGKDLHNKLLQDIKDHWGDITDE